MPANSLDRNHTEGTYFHVYNRGAAERVIFNDEEDYLVFVSYLREYLTPPASKEAVKTTFSVRGKTFEGIPHQSKNYFNQVELIAYSLQSTHFHLLLHQKTFGALEKFMRSLCTRYAIYFNKKYKSRGYLFVGPYKSAQISQTENLFYLTHYFHNLNNEHSSYREYLGTRNTEWIKPEIAVSHFKRNDLEQYGQFVENHFLDEAEKQQLIEIMLEYPPDKQGRGPPFSRKTPTLGFLSKLGIPGIITGIFAFLLLGLGNIIRH